MARRKIATEKEILEHFTSVMRGETEDAKVSDRNRAAEFLEKYYSSKRDSEDLGGGVVIVDDIGGGVQNED
ncbi:MAG: hypothetical protein PUF72_10090 [Clostridiales bacterium]|nr:hypothetical protein [Clostridiales bacterium]